MTVDADTMGVARDDFLRRAHGVINVLYLAGMHVGLAAWFWFAYPVLPIGLFVSVSLVVSVTHQRLLSEWFHEATHWNLLPDRRWNDWLSNLLIGIFLGARVHSNRPGHFRHHAVTEFFQAADPDTSTARAANRSDLLRGVGLDLCGYNALSLYLRRSVDRTQDPRQSARTETNWLARLVLLHASVFIFTVAAGRWPIYPLYFGSLITLYPVVNRIRLYGQHAWIGADGRGSLVGSRASRTLHASLLEQLLLNSPMIMYHHEHHAAPQLPYRALRAIAPPRGDPNTHGDSCLRVLGAVLRGLD